MDIEMKRYKVLHAIGDTEWYRANEVDAEIEALRQQVAELEVENGRSLSEFNELQGMCQQLLTGYAERGERMKIMRGWYMAPHIPDVDHRQNPWPDWFDENGEPK